jgi:hypothetical protein
MASAGNQSGAPTTTYWRVTLQEPAIRLKSRHRQYNVVGLREMTLRLKRDSISKPPTLINFHTAARIVTTSQFLIGSKSKLQEASGENQTTSGDSKND